ncbi:hypothetical protein [Paenibacillus chungangensis]|uniref:DUF3221 domain-containing protein n=1 Tax=Paenibacillus chungangensis TaxID=696535 RepID=A0ABW3HQ69_9BACL
MRLSGRNVIALFLLVVVAATIAYLFLTGEQMQEYEILYASNQEVFLKKVGNDDDSEESYARYTVSEDTILKDKRGDALAFRDLEIGQVVIVYPDEQSFVLLSGPPVLRAKEIIVLR